ncbi:hypothetical protein SAFG77S_08468 [Streptomyces afghaniensis]|uniref:hypothetical protein n=1 Tax=Streptomyces afghaniensis TaxID=66865 RepID=UPI000565A286|nr:hypothetical protein [Streptomyces afghaniensis]
MEPEIILVGQSKQFFREIGTAEKEALAGELRSLLLSDNDPRIPDIDVRGDAKGYRCTVPPSAYMIVYRAMVPMEVDKYKCRRGFIISEITKLIDNI